MFGRRGLVAIALLMAAKGAHAEETHAFRLAYAAPPECPSADAFARAILASSTLAHAAAEGEPATTITVQLGPQSGGYLGVLGLTRADGSASSRAVPAATCEEASSAMVLIAAIAVDPEASVQASPGAIGVFATPPPAPPVVVPSPPPPVPVPMPPPPAPPPRDTERFELAIAAGGGVVGAVAPSPSPEVVLPALGAGLAGDRPFSPWLELSGRLSESLLARTARGEAQFERLAARLTACPLKLTHGQFSARPCAFGEVGRFHAKGESTSNASSTTLTWSALGLTARGEVGLAEGFLVGAEVGALFPLLRDRFQFDPDGTQVHAIPAAGFTGSLYVGFQIL